jgi:predicted Zn-dependent protease
MCARSAAFTVGSLLALTLGGAGSLGAQSSAAAAWQATPASVLKGALRSVAAAQERYRAANGTYATSLDRLGVRPESGVRVDILGASATGWQAKATHQTQRGRSCVVFVGALESVEAPRTDGDGEMAGEEGIPLCDRMR